MSEKTYEIAGRKYVQRPIVLGQLRLLAPVLAGIEVKSRSAAELISVIGAKLADALAVVLVEEGARIEEAMEPENLEKRSGVLEWSLTPETAIEVAEDFFGMNRVSSTGERIAAALETLMPERTQTTGSNPSSSGCARETSPSASESSGACLPESPSIGCESGSGSEAPPTDGS
jgi:hypothetical protein